MANNNKANITTLRLRIMSDTKPPSIPPNF